ncbi:MAG: hypothetical protein E6I53_04380 [Chloroflexi bacterium]|nr:MAG: hypothetical protein E6I53_04380 [Chloroflexota bacterium]
MARLWGLIDRRALVVTAACLVMWRVLDQIPLSDVTHTFITARLSSLSIGPEFFAAIGPNSLPFASWSIGYEGIAPYVEALVLMSVLTAVSARLQAMAAHPDGRQILARWTRVIALLLALGQAYGLTVLYQFGNPPVFGPLDWSARLAVCLALAGGTAITILLADALDDFGLGFGYGAVILFALAPLGFEVHRLAGYFASTPSIDALYRPVALWASFTIGMIAAGVAALLAVRRVAGTELRLLMPGVLRPTQFAAALLSIPVWAANNSYTNFPAAQWIYDNWRSYGRNGLPNVGYLLIYAGLLVGFALFVVVLDDRLKPMPSRLRPHALRLGVISGLVLAFAVIAVPVVDRFLTRASGFEIPITGADLLLLVAVILFAVRAIEGHRPNVPLTASPSGLP